MVSKIMTLQDMLEDAIDRHSDLLEKYNETKDDLDMEERQDLEDRLALASSTVDYLQGVLEDLERHCDDVYMATVSNVWRN